ncbi:AbrB/MazE/SpoVT family DNA-binding domain-containing protein [Candidatus Saccharibacteria bacterium]|nr:AbrB/MazE/SpoVT family DNA-binding domain-containing protein [Candidatus Saccharibacteria bacterium]
MANRSHKERNVRALQQSNGTYHITLPKEAVKKLNWRERQKLEVTKRGKKLIIADWQE